GSVYQGYDPSTSSKHGVFVGWMSGTLTNCYSYVASTPSTTQIYNFGEESSATLNNCYSYSKSGLSSTPDTTAYTTFTSVPDAWDNKLIWYMYATNGTERPTLWIHNPNGRLVNLTTQNAAKGIIQTYRTDVELADGTCLEADTTSTGSGDKTDSFYIDTRYRMGSAATGTSALNDTTANDQHLYFRVKDENKDNIPNRDRYVLVVTVNYYNSFVSSTALTTNEYTQETTDTKIQKVVGVAKFDNTSTYKRWRPINVTVTTGKTIYSVVLNTPSLQSMSGATATAGGVDLSYYYQIKRNGASSFGTETDTNKDSQYDASTADAFSNISRTSDTVYDISNSVKLYYGDTIKFILKKGTSTIPFSTSRYSTSANISTTVGWFQTSSAKTASAILNDTNVVADDTNFTPSAQAAASTDNTLEILINPTTAMKFADYVANKNTSNKHYTPKFRRLTKVVLNMGIVRADNLKPDARTDMAGDNASDVTKFTTPATSNQLTYIEGGQTFSLTFPATAYQYLSGVNANRYQFSAAQYWDSYAVVANPSNVVNKQSGFTASQAAGS
ncbi:MAG: hypothetical protein IJA69_01635, partial [Clostridia bacterium]|nr:hypothetical protein [Clostridia bacterium]